MELAHWADHTETRLGLTKRAPVPGAEGTQVLTKLRSAPLRFCLLGLILEANVDVLPVKLADWLSSLCYVHS